MRALIALSTLAAAFRTPTHRVTARKPDKKPPQTVAPILVAASTAVPVDPAPPKRRAWLRFFADTDDAPRRSARSWITEQCARGWIRDQKKRGRLALEHVERVDAVEPEECDVSEGLSRRCPDVVRLTSSGVVWIGARPGGPKLVASRLEAELVNLHRRVLTGGRRGSLVAELTMTGADLDGSLWIRRRLDGIVRKVLVKWMGKEVCVADDALDFRTTIDAGGRARVDGTARVRRAPTPLERYASGDGGYRESNFRFAVSFVLEADRGAILFRDPVVSLPDRPSFEAPPQWLWASQPTYALALAHTTTPLVEGGAALFLSSVTVDPTASFSITSLVPSAATPGALVATVESGPQKFSRSRLFRRGRSSAARAARGARAPAHGVPAGPRGARGARGPRGPRGRGVGRPRGAGGRGLEQRGAARRRRAAALPKARAVAAAQSSYAAAGALPKAAVAAAQTVGADFLVMPNPGYVDVAALAAGLAPRDFARAAERSRRGFGLAAVAAAQSSAPARCVAHPRRVDRYIMGERINNFLNKKPWHPSSFQNQEKAEEERDRVFEKAGAAKRSSADLLRRAREDDGGGAAAKPKAGPKPASGESAADAKRKAENHAKAQKKKERKRRKLAEQAASAAAAAPVAAPAAEPTAPAASAPEEPEEPKEPTFMNDGSFLEQARLALLAKDKQSR
ncbi:hypothetical protein SO694_00071151 [Aureococcus anophagefferens]|uniref:CBF1-interacting co-repressor CIR N-terminal domain-containing protein n=1 Tax=Aureococcus anophagefferens TaxID=44056 RepID=A0ABR1FI74_AURAN